MDWAKAKTIIIAILLSIDLVLAGVYIYNIISENNEAKRSAENCKSYAASRGIEVECSIPTKTPKEQALQVTFTENPESKAAKYNSLEIVYGGNEDVGYEIDDTGKSRLKISSASQAVTRFIQENSKQDDTKIEIISIDLVYWIEGNNAQPGNVETAVPAWRITTSDGNVNLYNAFSN